MFKEYYTRRPFLENKNAILNIAFTDRSDGKTFDTKFCAIDDYEKTKDITLYIRRYKTEFTPAMYMNFMNELVDKDKTKNIVNKYEFNGCKQGVMIRKKGVKDWDWLFYFAPLSMSAKLKSTFDVSRIKTIVFDEYIPLDNRYLKDEVNIILELYKSIDRDRFTTKLYIFGNKITPFNPLFDYFNIDIVLGLNRIKMYREGTLAVQLYSSSEHREVRKISPFGKLVKGTKYEEYESGGILQQINIKIGDIKNAKYFASFKTELGSGSIWFNGQKIVISKRVRKDGAIIVDKIYNENENEILANYGNIPSFFKEAYRQGNIYVDEPKTWYMFERIIIKAGAK